MVYTPGQFRAVLKGLGYRLGSADEAEESEPPDCLVQTAIREFQTQFELPVTGECDRTTQEKARQLIRNLQHSLNLTIAAELPVNEFYGIHTARAVQRFQQKYGLPVTGIAERSTRQQLCEAVKQQLREMTSEPNPSCLLDRATGTSNTGTSAIGLTTTFL